MGGSNEEGEGCVSDDDADDAGSDRFRVDDDFVNKGFLRDSSEATFPTSPPPHVKRSGGPDRRLSAVHGLKWWQTLNL